MSMFTLSIVSHGHKSHIELLFNDLLRVKKENLDIILTINIPEDLPSNIDKLPFPVKIIRNEKPKGFAANHNAAFIESLGETFIILNPDIQLIDNPFSVISTYLKNSPNTVCAPIIVNQFGHLEDSARLFPTPIFLVKKLVFKILNIKLKSDTFPEDDQTIFPDWIAGMFMVIPRETYQQLGGLNEHYHMYYEDVDFCVRVQLAGQSIAVIKTAKVIHEAQRDSHRKIQHFIWHLQSILKFFMSKSYLQLKLSRFRGYMNKN